MRNIDTGEVAFVSLVLMTNCGKTHRVVHYGGHTFLCNQKELHPSCKAMGITFSLKNFVCDPDIPTDNALLLEECDAFLSNWGSKGKVEKEGDLSWFLSQGTLIRTDTSSSSGELVDSSGTESESEEEMTIPVIQSQSKQNIIRVYYVSVFLGSITLSIMQVFASSMRKTSLISLAVPIRLLNFVTRGQRLFPREISQKRVRI